MARRHRADERNHLGAEMPDSETTGDVMRRATSCSGWTEHRYNGITVRELGVLGTTKTYL